MGVCSQLLLNCCSFYPLPVSRDKLLRQFFPSSFTRAVVLEQFCSSSGRSKTASKRAVLIKMLCHLIFSKNAEGTFPFGAVAAP